MIKKIFIWLEANIWKHFVILLTARRNFIPILSIYYLSLPNTKAQEIWFYTAVWYVASLFFQIPAWIIWDRLWNKTTIIISKILLVLSSLIYIIWDNFWYFIVWSALMSLWIDAFSTWNTSVFLHDTLIELKKENKFKEISSSIKWWVSFLSIFFIIALPFFTTISLVFPFKIGLVIDIVGLLVALSLFPARWHAHKHEKITLKILKTTLNESKWSWLLPVIVFSSIIWAFLIVDSSFRSPYLQSIWYPVIYIGFVMWISRFVRFLVWKYAHKIENIFPFKTLMLIETFIFWFYYMLVSFIDNPYIVWWMFSLIVWYFWWRSEIYTDHIINLIPWKKYKSTILSIKWQISGIIQITLMVFIWFLMTKSYKLWFFVMWLILFLSLLFVYFFFIRKLDFSHLEELNYID